MTALDGAALPARRSRRLAPAPSAAARAASRDRMPAADAVADAETLRLALKITKSGNPDCYVKGGFAVAALVHPGVVHQLDAAVPYAIEAARAAFRAVPGLRG